jgi:hypothetical protein
MECSHPVFPTALHSEVAEIVKAYFIKFDITDTVLIVNSCARGQASAESDLDIAILVKDGVSNAAIKALYKRWLKYSAANKSISTYKSSCIYRHLHLDVINGIYTPTPVELGEPIDFFEVEIGNQVCYVATMNDDGEFFKLLRQKWLPYYNEELRLQRLKMVIDACHYDLDHIAFYKKRSLHFHAFYILYKAFEEYLQALFIANKIYPLAYNKWIKYQVTELLQKPDLYLFLGPVLSIADIEGDEINDKVHLLTQLINDLQV